MKEMKIDRRIEQKLKLLAQSVRLSPDTVRDAERELSYGQVSRKPVFRRVFAGVSAACVIIAVIIVVAVLTRGHSQPETVVPYQLNSLQAAFVAETDTQALPFSTFENALYTQKTFIRDGEVEVVGTKIIHVTEQGTNELLIYEDSGGGLQDFKGYQSYAEQEIDGVTVRLHTEYKNGEHYSYCYYEKADTDYYIIMMSPNPNAVEYYFQNYC